MTKSLPLVMHNSKIVFLFERARVILQLLCCSSVRLQLIVNFYGRVMKAEVGNVKCNLEFVFAIVDGGERASLHESQCIDVIDRDRQKLTRRTSTSGNCCCRPIRQLTITGRGGSEITYRRFRLMLLSRTLLEAGRRLQSRLFLSSFNEHHASGQRRQDCRFPVPRGPGDASFKATATLFKYHSEFLLFVVKLFSFFILRGNISTRVRTFELGTNSTVEGRIGEIVRFAYCREAAGMGET